MDNNNPELAIYRLLFKAILASNAKDRVSNTSVDHAIVLIEELIRSSKSSVDIFAHQLSHDVWADVAVKAAVLDAMSRGVVFRVIVQVKNAEEIARSPFASMASEIRCYDKEELKANFILVDRHAFRFEPSYSERKGFSYVNNEELSGTLLNAFESIYQTAHLG